MRENCDLDSEAKIQQARSDLKRSSSEERRISAQFRHLKGDAVAIDLLKSEMQQASAIRREAEDRLRELTSSHAHHTAVTNTDMGSDAPDLPPSMTYRPAAGPTPDSLRIEQLTDVNSTAWDEYVTAHPGASIYHDRRWGNVITETMGQESGSLLALAHGKVVGVLPLYKMKSRLFGCFGVSLPYLNYGGSLTDTVGVSDALLEQATEWAAREKLEYLEIREFREREGWPSRTDKLTMVRRLPNSVKKLDAEIGTKVRSQIRRGAKEGLTHTFGRQPLLDDFYDVFSENMRDLGTPVYSKQLFRRILELFEEAELIVVWQGTRAIGCAFLLRHRGVLEIPWASTLRKMNSIGTNMYLYWNVLCRAIELDCEHFDFGRSTAESGTYRFKKQWGARECPLVWNYWLAEGQKMPGLNPDNPKFRLMIEVWKRMPVGLTRLIGPGVVRKLP